MRSIAFTPDEVAIVKQLPLISAKPLIYACNIDVESIAEEGSTNAMARNFTEYVNNKYPNIPVVTLSALLENEIVKIRNEDGDE